jgi:hypothetical protein
MKMLNPEYALLNGGKTAWNNRGGYERTFFFGKVRFTKNFPYPSNVGTHYSFHYYSGHPMRLSINYHLIVFRPKYWLRRGIFKVSFNMDQWLKRIDPYIF